MPQDNLGKVIVQRTVIEEKRVVVDNEEKVWLLNSATETLVITFKGIPSTSDISMDRLNVGEFRASRISGILWGQSVSSNASGSSSLSEIPLSDAVNSFGEWAGVFRAADGSTVIAGDPFGYCPIFMASFDDGNGCFDLIVGNSFPAVVEECRIQGHTVSANAAYPGLVLGTQHSIAHTLVTSDTPLNEVRLLKPREVLFVTNGGFACAELRDPDDSLTYEELISKGVDKALRSINQMCSAGTEMQIRLSGGKDSRTVLSLLEAAGVAQDISVFTVDPRRAGAGFAAEILPNDLRISSYLKDRNGMKWSVPGESLMRNIEPHEHLLSWQKYRGGYNFKYSPSVRGGTRVDELVEIYGGTGEVFRSFWARSLSSNKYLKGVSWTSEAKYDDADKLFDFLYRPWLIGADEVENVRHRFIRSLELERHSDLTDAIDEHYANYRNRGHFGTARAAANSNVFNALPLSQVEFLKASKLLAQDDRLDGKVLFDIIQMTSPSLNEIEFESGRWPGRFGVSTYAEAPELDARDYYAALDFGRDRVSHLDPIQSGPSFDPNAWLGAQFDQTHQELLEAEPFAKYFDEGRGEALKRRFDGANLAEKGRVLSKLQAMRSALSGQIADCRLEFESKDGKLIETAPSQGSVRTVAASPIRRNPELVNCELKLFHLANSKVVASVDVRACGGSDLEFAFYFFQGDKRTAFKWFSPSTIAEFEPNPAYGDEIAVRAFVRVRGAGEPLVTLENELER